MRLCYFISCVKGTLSVTQHMIETMDNYQNVNLQGLSETIIKPVLICRESLLPFIYMMGG